jgi:hypothetical protein
MKVCRISHYSSQFIDIVMAVVDNWGAFILISMTGNPICCTQCLLVSSSLRLWRSYVLCIVLILYFSLCLEDKVSCLNAYTVLQLLTNEYMCVLSTEHF